MTKFAQVADSLLLSRGIDIRGMKHLDFALLGKSYRLDAIELIQKRPSAKADPCRSAISRTLLHDLIRVTISVILEPPGGSGLALNAQYSNAGSTTLTIGGADNGNCCRSRVPVIWSACIALARAAVCLDASQRFGRLSRTSKVVCRMRTICVVAGHFVYLLAAYFEWIAIDHPADPNIGAVLFALVLILVSLSKWLVCAFLHGTSAIVTCWIVFVSIAATMTSLQLSLRK